ncbi:hypothetical protein LWI29_031089 [Acer saccharum]|uniref:Uncharacterized protein n=1 Tax=Acer saccharum TaxID=4024 RepID=A0AA39RHC4_ACESA|nr:hypothetical protein LWI29_031089 [Acer saccharum]
MNASGSPSDIETWHPEEGENHRGYARKVLSDYLQTLPAYLGGNCTCTKCSKISIRDKQLNTNETNRIQPYADVGDDEDLHPHGVGSYRLIALLQEWLILRAAPFSFHENRCAAMVLWCTEGRATSMVVLGRPPNMQNDKFCSSLDFCMLLWL